MIDQKYLRFTFISIIAISVVSGILSYFGIPYQLYLWELFIDAKILTVLVLLFFLNKKRTVHFSNIRLLFFNWNLKKNILFFSLPFFCYLISNFIGILFDQVELNRLENAPTLLLATVFDIPAFYVFSVTTVLIEELVFRGLLLSSVQLQQSKTVSFIVVSIVWGIYGISEIISMQDIDAIKFLTVLFSFFSLGIICSMLVDKFRSIWIGYSLRIGIISLTPITITSLLNESDSFFTSTSIIFVAEGVIFSICLLIASFVVNRFAGRKPIVLEEKPKM
jgi:membrane protease YdiL (CAAX protease family)